MFNTRHQPRLQNTTEGESQFTRSELVELAILLHLHPPTQFSLLHIVCESCHKSLAQLLICIPIMQNAQSLAFQQPFYCM